MVSPHPCSLSCCLILAPGNTTLGTDLRKSLVVCERVVGAVPSCSQQLAQKLLLNQARLPASVGQSWSLPRIPV